LTNFRFLAGHCRYEQYCWNRIELAGGDDWSELNERELFHWAPAATITKISESSSVRHTAANEFGSPNLLVEYAGIVLCVSN
jgi:hypothetical protein